MIIFLTENENIENYSVSATPQKIDEIDDISNSISDNISKEVKIPADVLNSFAIKSELNPKIWEGNKLRPIVRTKLVKIANDFFKELNLPDNVKMVDIIFTGSLANFNWSKFSDIDLHIVLDFDEINGDQQFKEDFFYAQKSLWNQAHDITVYEYPVELYAQDRTAKLVATAIYSVKKDKWVLEPKREEFKVNKKVIKQKADRFIDRLKDVRKDYEDGELQSVVDKVKSLKDKIKNYRTSGLEDGGEYSIENLVFKTLRRTPFMDILDSYKAKAYDKLMSVKESAKFKKTIKESLRTITEAKYSTKDDLYRTMFKVAKANELYGGDPYFNNPNEGQWVGAAVVNMHGHIRITSYKHAAGDVRSMDLGGRGESAFYKEFKIHANRGIEHPDTYSPKMGSAQTRGGVTGGKSERKFTMDLPAGVVSSTGQNFIDFSLPIPGSPASDAEIKAYIVYGQEIIDFVKKNLPDYDAYTAHGDAADISKEKMAGDPKLEKHKQRKDAIMALQQHLGRRPLEAEIQKYIETGNLPEKGGTKSLYDPEELDRREKERQAAIDRINKAKARRGL